MTGIPSRIPALNPRWLVWGLALLLAAGAILLSASGAQAAAKRGAVLVKDIWPGRSGSTKGPASPGNYVGGELTNVRGTLFFSAEDGKHGFELWRSDGTRRGTRMVRDINPGAGSSEIELGSPVSGTVYFEADDGIHGRELWRSDGTKRGTRMVKDINPGAGSSSVSCCIDVGGTLFFTVASPDEALAGLWRTDGTGAGTSRVKQVYGTGGAVGLKGTLYFLGDDVLFDHGGAEGLWRSDGTEAGTVLVKQLSACSCWMTGVNGTLYFLGEDGALWRSDGTEAGTTIVKDVSPPGAGSYSPCCFTRLTVLKGILYFTSTSSVRLGNDELWRSDGTAAGTILVKRIRVGTAFTLDPLVVMGSRLYFSTDGGLWRSNGTAQGTTLVTRNRRGGFFYTAGLTAAKGTLYFVATDKRYGKEVWRSDGTRRGTRLVRNIGRGAGSSQPQNLTAVGRSLFFTAKAGRHGRELWRAGPRPCKPAKGKCKRG